MYCIEMLVEEGSWSVSRWGKRAHTDVNEHHTVYRWKPGRGTWVLLSGQYASHKEATKKMVQYQASGSTWKPKHFQVVHL